MASKEQVRKELMAEFEGIDQIDGDFLNACAAIGELLSGGLGMGKVNAALGQLEAAMFKVIDDRLKPEAKEALSLDKRTANIGRAATQGGAFQPKALTARQEIMSQVKPLTTSGEDPFRKVLVTALAVFEKDLNYPANKDDTFHPRYVAFVKPADFLGNIARGAHWKDVGASPDHGEFTHRLQWFVIAASETVPLNTVGTVYRKVGQCGLRSKEADGIGQTDLWARLCDRPLQRLGKGKIGVAESNTDYRCPEHFSSYLRSAQASFPLLSSFLSARHGKRATVVDPDAFPSGDIMKDYCARKLYKAPKYRMLGEPERLKIDEIVKSGVLTVA